MKKRILFLLFLLLITPVKAKEVVRKYKYYEIIKEEGPYSLYITDTYPLIDYEDYIYTDYVETDVVPEPLEGREIEIVKYYKYKRTKNISYLKIQNKSTAFEISNIKIEYDGKPINYTYETKNGNLTELQKKGYIIFYFEKEIDQNRLKLTIEASTPGTTMLIITGDASSDQTQKTSVFTNLLEWYGTDATYYIYSDWVTDIYPYELNTSASRTLIKEGTINKYKYRDKLYKIYREYRNYSNDYLLKPEEPYTIKDESDFIDENIENNEQINKEDEQINDNAKMVNIKEKSDEKVKYCETIEVPNTGISIAN